MEFQQVVDRRRMIRNYDPDRPVPGAIAERLLTNALHAPSAGFSQGWAFLVLTEPVDRQQFWTVTTEGGEPDGWLAGMTRAPMIVLCFSHKAAYLARYAEPDKGSTDQDGSSWVAPYWDIDTGMAALLILLTAADEQLGACFFGVPRDHLDDLRSAFGIPAAYHPIGAITVGYPAPDRKSPSLRRGRRPVAEVVHRGRWGVTGIPDPSAQ